MQKIWNSIKPTISLLSVLFWLSLYLLIALVAGLWWSDLWVFKNVQLNIAIMCLIFIWITFIVLIVQNGTKAFKNIGTKFFMVPITLLSSVGFVYGIL